ncbi:hypothetical protein CBW65_02025 [Tumebacillus avium]|uniref:Spo0E family sporulation regulatory protein-aspartic acid phosphatase n=1 Tax=Tumebacillus avium TaxID=1903704 RepID=A0A1Y0IKL5_9BACL|nr:aspartyl-phosphate phosphatase Spo0E family protein [Tumebacillus avium]ARU59973.1 hypothetical protein CBW65_02025 [Tumebacillus avium]
MEHENENMSLEDTIETLRNEMHRLAEETGNLVNERVVRASQDLDQFLVKQQLRMRLET